MANGNLSVKEQARASGRALPRRDLCSHPIVAVKQPRAQRLRTAPPAVLGTRRAPRIGQSGYLRTEHMPTSDTLRRETRQAFRTLWRTPAFSLITFVTLALGIGAATAVFTLLDAVVLRP